MDSRTEKAASSLLDYEHRRFGVRIGLVTDAPESMSNEQVREIVYAVDELSWSRVDREQRLAVQLIGLAWEHAHSEQRVQLRPLFVAALSRLALGPSAGMLGEQPQDEDKLDALGSLDAQLASALLQFEFFEQIGPNGYYLTSFQKKVLDAIDGHRVVGISAPTSAGKSFALYLAIARHAWHSPSSVVYLVPTVSLINQVSTDIRSLFELQGLNKWSVRTNYQDVRERSVYVLTQERTLPNIMSASSTGLGLLIVDEIQNLERIDDGNDLRSKVLFDTLRELRRTSPDATVVLSGPRVRGIGILGAGLFESESVEVTTGQSPVANVTYSISKRRADLVLTQYSDFDRRGRTLVIDKPEVVQGLGQTQYTEEFLRFLSSLIGSLGPDSKNVVFSPTTEQARRTAIALSRAGTGSGTYPSSELERLAEYLAASIHPAYDLVECVRRGVAFHSGSVPAHARLVVELAYSDGLLKDLVCTTTLMQGVNLPASVVVVRNPQLFIKRQAGSAGPYLSDYEFANLRGRAGRLMKDFVGRTLVLDEEAFAASSDQSELFPEAEKTIASGYRNVFSRCRDEVSAELLTPGVAAGSAKFLATYIRQTVLREGDNAAERLDRVGISVGPEDLRRIAGELRSLPVGKEVCLANRYWDPFDLQAIKDNLDGASMAALPDGPWAVDAIAIERWLRFQVAVVPHYAERYLGKRAELRLQSWAISALEWARERPLSEIIRQRHFKGDISGQIDNQVADIQKHVVYGIPALLKPIADIQGSGHGLLASIESGSSSPVSMLLARQGLYRETAISIRRRLMPQLGDSTDLNRLVLQEVEHGFESLHYWIQRQLAPLMRQWRREVEHGKGKAG